MPLKLQRIIDKILAWAIDGEIWTAEKDREWKTLQANYCRRRKLEEKPCR